MANINLENLYDPIRIEFSQATTNADFSLLFVYAANRAAARITREANLTTAVSRADSQTDTISLDEAYEDVLLIGIRLNLIESGFRLRGDPKRVPSAGELDRAFTVRIGDIQSDIRNTDQASEDTNAVFGLGVLAN